MNPSEREVGSIGIICLILEAFFLLQNTLIRVLN